MSTVIKNGTIVTHDLTYKSDILIDGSTILEIGPNLKGNNQLDASDCYIMPGGIDPHTHLEMPFMGTYSSDDFESGTRAALAGGTTMVVDFALPSPGESLLDAIKRWDNKSTRANCDYSFHMAVTWWGEKVFNDMKTVIETKGINTFKHFLAYKGALMVNDDELYASFSRLAELGGIAMVHAENGDVVAELSAKLLAEGNTGPEAHAYSRPSQVEGEATNRAIMIADMAGVPLYVVHTSCEEAQNNIELITDRPLEVNLKEMRQIKKDFPDRALVASVMVPCEEMYWKDIIPQIAETGVDGFELNFGCPHGMSERGMGSAVGQVPEYIEMVTRWCKESTELPVIVKLTPNITNIIHPAAAAKNGGADAVSLINTISSIVSVDLDN